MRETDTTDLDANMKAFGFFPLKGGDNLNAFFRWNDTGVEKRHSHGNRMKHR